METRCANCDVVLDMTNRVWFFNTIVCCSESCARDYIQKIKN